MQTSPRDLVHVQQPSRNEDLRHALLLHHVAKSASLARVMRRAQQQQALAKASAASPDGRNMNSSKHRTCCPSVRAHWRPFLYSIPEEIESRVQQSCEANCSTSDRTHTENHQTEDNPHHVNLDMKNPRALRKPRMAQVGFQVHCRKTALKLLEKCNMEEVQVDSRLCKPEAASDHSFRKVQYKAWKNMFCIFSGMKQ